MALRVVQWATGHVGLDALRGIIQHPELELVGVRVYSDSKNGTDAGDLCGLATTGVLATTDVDAIIALAPDCVCYTAQEAAGIEPVIADLCRLLGAGINVVSSALLPLVYPPGVNPLMAPAVQAIEAAAQQGGATLYVTGVNPGCLLDVLPPLLASGCREITSITVHEHWSDISWYQQGALAQQLFGIGLTPEAAQEALPVRLGIMSEYFGCALKLLAHGLGSEIREITTTFESVIATAPFMLHELKVEVGSVGAAHARLEGQAGGTTLIYHEYVSGHPDVARPGWPEPPRGGGGYVVEIAGSPDLRVEMSFGQGGALAMADAFNYTSNRLVNAIPTVCVAAPGLTEFQEIARSVAGTVSA